MPQHDLVIRGGLIATATDTFVADLGIRNGRIASIAERLEPEVREIDAGRAAVSTSYGS